MNINEELPKGFNWEDYLDLNPDLKKLSRFNNKAEAEKHWIMFGKKEGRPYDKGNVISINNKSENNIVVYTAISNGYDELKEVIDVEDGVDYICFTDSDITSETWTIRNIPEELHKLDDVRICRNIKINTHLYLPEYQYSVWVDGNIQVIGNIKKLVRGSMEKNIFCIPKHPYRNCIYDEADEVKKQQRDDRDIVNDVVNRYKKEGYPKKNGLVQSNIIIRQHNDIDSIDICEQWWNEVLKYSKRDQLSFNYVCWKNKKFKVGFFESKIISSNYFTFYNHDNTVYDIPDDYGVNENYFNGIEITETIKQKETHLKEHKELKIVFELPHSNSTSGGVRETLKIASKIPNTSIRFQSIKSEYPKISNKWTVGATDNTFPSCDVCVTYSDTKHLSELTSLPQVNKVFLNMLSYGMSLDRERKNIHTGKITVLCSSKKIEKEILSEGVRVHRIGFPLDMNEMFNKNIDRKNYVALLYSPSEGKRYNIGVSVVDELYKKGVIEGVITFGTNDGYQNFKHPVGLVKHYVNANRFEINEIFNICKCFLMPSISEGINLTPVESTMCGCPSIICDGAIGEVFFDRKNCIITEKDNILTMMKNVSDVITNFKQYSDSFYNEMKLIVEEHTIEKVNNNFNKILNPRQIVIIPVHNQLTYLKKCVKSVINETENLELIIVDDGSTDIETVKWIDKLENCNVIRHEKPLGFSKSCNDGIDFAMDNFDFDCLCLLNSDTEVVTSNWFETVQIELSKKERIGIIGVVSDNAVSQTIHNVPSYLKTLHRKPTLYSTLVHGFCFFITKELISTIGRFDEDTFPHYGSEDDYALKSVKAGFKNIIVGSVLVKHKGSSSYTSETRLEHMKKSVPNFSERWGQKYIEGLIKESQEIQKKFNN